MSCQTCGSSACGTPIPGSRQNDVLANINITRTSDLSDPPGVFRVLTEVAHCLDASCGSFQQLDVQDLGPLNVKQKTTVLVNWDQANDRFIFRRNAIEVSFTYSLPDTALPGVPDKRLLVNGLAANCTTAPRPVAFMRAFYDNIQVNPSAAP